jgi:peroxiredoxin
VRVSDVLDALPGVGDPAPDAQLLDLAGNPLSLSASWTDGPAVVVFLRYFGCPFCQMQVVSLREQRHRFVEAGAKVVLVGQGQPEAGDAFTQYHRLQFPCLLDPHRAAYRAYGLGEGSPLQVFSPRVGVPFLRANAHAATRQRGLRGGNFWQMPGTFVVDRAGVIGLAHRNRHIGDSPSNDDLLRAVAELAPRA